VLFSCYYLDARTANWFPVLLADPVRAPAHSGRVQLGLIFLPWTTLVYTLLYRPGGLFGFDWFWLALAFLADLSAFAASAARRRDASWYTGP